MKLWHILVKYEYEAQDLLRRLAKNEDFELLARRTSLCSSSANGGFLGDFSGPGASQLQRLDPDFLQAVEDLPLNKVSNPIRTRFGYHLILRK